MSDALANQFRDALGITAMLKLAVSGPGIEGTREFVIDTPYAIIGNSQGCEVSLEAGRVAFRHAYLQPIAGRLACLELFGTGGVKFQNPAASPWLQPGESVQLGEYQVKLTGTGWLPAADIRSPLDFKPRDEVHTDYGEQLPAVRIHMLNKSLKDKSWPINRIITLLGRDKRCRITFADEEVSKVHASFVLTKNGLWIVDLLGRGGVLVGDQRVRCAPLPDGAQLKIGRYRMHVEYESTGTPSDPESDAPQEGAALAASDSAANVVDSRPSPEFLTRQHKAFRVQTAGRVLIVIPQGDARNFRYQDIHIESNRIVNLLSAYDFPHLVIDLSQCGLVGTVIISALTNFCRSAKGKAAFADATHDLYDALLQSKILNLWYHYATVQDAVIAVQHPG